MWRESTPYLPQDEAGLTTTFQTWPRGCFHVAKHPDFPVINLDFAMSASQQGVLLVDEDSIPDDLDLEDIVEEWTKYRGVIKLKMKGASRLRPS